MTDLVDVTRVPDEDETPVTLGKIGRVHGIRGWLKLHSFTDPPANLCDYRQFAVVTDRGLLHLELDEVQEVGRSLVAHFTGYDAPETARTLTGLALQVPRKELPRLAAGEYYWHQLVGLTVTTVQGQELGRIEKMLETGAHDVMQVVPTESSVDRIGRLIPWRTGTVVVKVDLPSERITVDWGVDWLT